MKNQQSLERQTFKAGDFIFFEGDVESHFYIIEKGLVSIFTKDSLGNKIGIADLGEGEPFGEFALISQSPRSAFAQAKEDCVVVKISEEGYKKLLGDLPPWARSMLKSLTDRVQNMTEKIRFLEKQGE